MQITCVRGNHWICLSTVGCQPSEVIVYDSLNGRLDPHTKKLVADIMQSRERHIDIFYADVQHQSGSNDCGLFAIALATSVCYGKDPATSSFKQSNMRSHLFSCIEKGKMEPLPTRATRRPKLPKTETFPIYCVCRLGDDGTEMVQCSTCNEWYYVSCVSVPLHISLNSEELLWPCSSCF